MRRFLPAGGGGEPSSSSSSGGHQHHQHGGLASSERAAAGLRYRGGADISLGHGHGHDDGGHGRSIDAADRRNDGSMDMLARHSSSPVGFFSNLVVDNGELARDTTVPFPCVLSFIFTVYTITNWAGGTN